MLQLQRGFPPAPAVPAEVAGALGAAAACAAPGAEDEATRPDHILANLQALPSLVDVRVNHLQRGSDHWPLEACLQLPWQVPTPVQCSGIPISQRKWRPAAQADYVRSLQAQPALRASLDAAGCGDPTGSLQLLYTAIWDACTLWTPRNSSSPSASAVL